MTALNCLFVGDHAHREFQTALAVLSANWRVSLAADPSEAVAVLRQADEPFALVLVAQSWAGQFHAEQVHRMRLLAPSTPVVGLMGSWCEGEPRSGSVWPGVARMYWHQAGERLAADLARVAARKCPAWSLPSTATEEERALVVDYGERLAPATVLVVADDHDLAACLTDICRQHGLFAFRLLRLDGRPIDSADVVIWDTPVELHEAISNAKTLSSAWPTAAVIGLRGFVRRFELGQLLDEGLVAVLSKPLNWSDLVSRLSFELAASAV